MWRALLSRHDVGHYRSIARIRPACGQGTTSGAGRCDASINLYHARWVMVGPPLGRGLGAMFGGAVVGPPLGPGAGSNDWRGGERFCETNKKPPGFFQKPGDLRCNSLLLRARRRVQAQLHGLCLPLASQRRAGSGQPACRPTPRRPTRPLSRPTRPRLASRRRTRWLDC